MSYVKPSNASINLSRYHRLCWFRLVGWSSLSSLDQRPSRSLEGEQWPATCVQGVEDADEQDTECQEDINPNPGLFGPFKIPL